MELMGLGAVDNSAALQLPHSIAEIDGFLSRAGMERSRLISFGFGPFTFAYRKVLPEWLGVRVHKLLQHLADLGVPGICSVGAQFLILAQKNPVSK